jgi:hypothetical protein
MRNKLKDLGKLLRTKIIPTTAISLSSLVLAQGCETLNESRGIQEIYELTNQEKARIANFSTGAYHVFEIRNYSFSLIERENEDYFRSLSFYSRGNNYCIELKSKDRTKLERISGLDEREIVLGMDFYKDETQGQDWVIYCDGKVISRNSSSPDMSMGGRILFGQYLFQK